MPIRTGEVITGSTTVTVSIQINPAQQNIDFTPPATGTFGQSGTLSAIGGDSGNPVVFTVDSSTWAGTCSLSVTNGTTITYSGVGNCIIDTNQAGNSNYLPASQVREVVPVVPASQTISFIAPTSGSVGGTATLSATGGPSGEPVIFTVDPATAVGTCSVSGVDGEHAKYGAVGLCRIDANQAGNSGRSGPGTYNPGLEVQRTITIQKASTAPSIALSPSTVPYGTEQSETITVHVSSQYSSPIPTGEVHVAMASATVCIISLTKGAGTCSLAPTEFAIGSYKLQADYEGDKKLGASRSASSTLKVA